MIRILSLNPCIETGAIPTNSKRLPICWCSSKQCKIHKGWYGNDQWNEMNPLPKNLNESEETPIK